MKRHFWLAAAVLVALVTVPAAQMKVVPVDEQQGHAALGLALRHLANAGIYMMATAHPDDENNGLLVMLNRGQGYRTALATATRGNGGQNEIGPELFEALGVLRTEELAALHRFDGAEQYFTRAVDFGFTIDIDETLQKWGRDEIIGDYVRLIRTVRPDVISGMPPTAMGPGQHAHHAVSGILSREAYKAAGDPTKYPEQIKEGLRAWQPKKYYTAAGFGGGGAANQAQPPARTTPRTIRCSARRTRKSAPKRAACTSVRGRRSYSRCPGRRPVRFSWWNRPSPARWIATSVGSLTASTQASAA
jgi:LmbE family N-acetylglucosaminyl deacetylase